MPPKQDNCLQGAIALTFFKSENHTQTRTNTPHHTHKRGNTSPRYFFPLGESQQPWPISATVPLWHEVECSSPIHVWCGVEVSIIRADPLRRSRPLSAALSRSRPLLGSPGLPRMTLFRFNFPSILYHQKTKTPGLPKLPKRVPKGYPLETI